jgi:hypothetical protein
VLILPFWVLAGVPPLVISPFLAVWYMRICQKEIAMLKHKTLIHLK